MRKLVGVGLLVVGIAVLLIVYCRRTSTPPPEVSDAGVSDPGISDSSASLDLCHGSEFTAAGTPEGNLPDGCRLEDCGLNGAWLGQGVPFRQLDLTGKPDPKSHLFISKFTSANHIRLKIGFAQDSSDELVGTAGSLILRGPQLVGSEIELSLARDKADNAGPAVYRLQIVNVSSIHPWACPGGQCNLSHDAPLYQFSVTRLSPGSPCRVDLCAPDLNNDWGTLKGSAVIFKGDIYDDDKYKIRSDDFPNGADRLKPSEQNLFNIACVGTAISKLHFLGHTSASNRSTTHTKRQAMLRLLTADYCGTGHPFTENGHPIRLGFKDESGMVSEYDMKDAVSIDARWDEHGATCIGTPRLKDRIPDMISRVRRYCGLPCGILSCDHYNPRVNIDCGPVGSPTQPLDTLLNGSYAISGNKFP